MFSNWILDYLQIKQGSRQNKRTTEHLNTAWRNPALNGRVKKKIKILQAKWQSIAELLQSVSEGSNRLTCGLFFFPAWVFVAKILTFRYKQNTHGKKKRNIKTSVRDQFMFSDSVTWTFEVTQWMRRFVNQFSVSIVARIDFQLEWFVPSLKMVSSFLVNLNPYQQHFSSSKSDILWSWFQLSHEKTPPTFHYSGCLKGILI